MSDTTTITLSHRFARSDDVLFQEVGGEAVLLDLASEQYFGLNEVGSRIWQLLESAPALGDVHRILCMEFDADADRIERDMLVLLEQLSASGLVRRCS